MSRDVSKLADRMTSMHGELMKLYKDLSAQHTKESRVLEELEQGADFDAGLAEAQGELVKALEQATSQLEDYEENLAESVDELRDLLET